MHLFNEELYILYFIYDVKFPVQMCLFDIGKGEVIGSHANTLGTVQM